MIDDLCGVFGIKPCFVDEGVGVFGLENVLMPVGWNFLEVVAPVERTPPADATSTGAAATAATW